MYLFGGFFIGNSFSGNHQPKEHGLLLYLSPELQLGVCKLQVERKLGRSYAGLSALVEGLFRFGCIDEETHKILAEKYSRSVIPEAEPRKPRTMAEAQALHKLQELEKYFSMALGQWQTISEKSKSCCLKKARENSTIPNAKLILALLENER